MRSLGCVGGNLYGSKGQVVGLDVNEGGRIERSWKPHELQFGLSLHKRYLDLHKACCRGTVKSSRRLKTPLSHASNCAVGQIGIGSLEDRYFPRSAIRADDNLKQHNSAPPASRIIRRWAVGAHRLANTTSTGAHDPIMKF